MIILNYKIFKKMKNIAYLISFITTIILLNACSDLLEREVVLSMTEQDVITTYGNTQAREYAIYTIFLASPT